MPASLIRSLLAALTVMPEKLFKLENIMIRVALLLCVLFSLQGCFGTEYELKKYYKDPFSAAAKFMGGTYAGVVETFNSLDAFMQMKQQVEKDDRDIGYTNSRFVCDEN
jgi:hypothetical protein